MNIEIYDELPDIELTEAFMPYEPPVDENDEIITISNSNDIELDPPSIVIYNYVIVYYEDGIIDFQDLPDQFSEIKGVDLRSKFKLFTDSRDHIDVLSVTNTLEKTSYNKFLRLKEHFGDKIYLDHSSLSNFNNELIAEARRQNFQLPHNHKFIFPLSDLRTDLVGDNNEPKIELRYSRDKLTRLRSRTEIFYTPTQISFLGLQAHWFFGDPLHNMLCLKDLSSGINTILNDSEYGWIGVNDHYLLEDWSSTDKITNPTRIRGYTKQFLSRHPRYIMCLLRTNLLSANNNRRIENKYGSRRDYFTAINDFKSIQPFALQNDANFDDFIKMLILFLGQENYELFLNEIKTYFNINNFTRLNVIKSMTLPQNYNLLATI